MERRDRQRGATLLMVIGVVAALAVLAKDELREAMTAPRSAMPSEPPT